MIRVVRKPEPAGFEKMVRAPGRAFLAGCPNPTQKQWNTHSYWRKVLCDLHRAYGGICGYSCHWIPYDTGADTVEHFKPKSRHPQDAYEWRNYRLVCQLLNSRKGDNEDILDPFRVKNDWFTIEFPALLIKPAPGLPKALTARINTTRDVLGLNDEATCMATREQYVTDYCLGEIDFVHLQKRSPFLALQMKKQGYDRLAEIRKVMNIHPPAQAGK